MLVLSRIMTARSETFAECLQEVVTPKLNDIGFVFDKSRTYRRLVREQTGVEIINFQLGQRRLEGKFTVNLGVLTEDHEKDIELMKAYPYSCNYQDRIGYILWIFGFMGAHRFYFGRPVSGTIYFFTLGIFLIGWIVDLFLIPGMDRTADMRYTSGNKDYTLGWILLTFLGIFGVHRFYLGKWITGLIWLLTGGLCLIGVLYDIWTLNEQIDEINRGIV